MRVWRNIELPRLFRRWQREKDREMVDYFWGDLSGEEGPTEDLFCIRKLFGLEPYEKEPEPENWDLDAVEVPHIEVSRSAEGVPNGHLPNGHLEEADRCKYLYLLFYNKN